MLFTTILTKICVPEKQFNSSARSRPDEVGSGIDVLAAFGKFCTSDFFVLPHW